MAAILHGNEYRCVATPCYAACSLSASALSLVLLLAYVCAGHEWWMRRAVSTREKCHIYHVSVVSETTETTSMIAKTTMIGMLITAMLILAKLAVLVWEGQSGWWEGRRCGAQLLRIFYLQIIKRMDIIRTQRFDHHRDTHLLVCCDCCNIVLWCIRHSSAASSSNANRDLFIGKLLTKIWIWFINKQRQHARIVCPIWVGIRDSFVAG